MAKLRSVDTHFWKDGYIIDLDPIEKLLFLYLLTNPSTTLAGCYEMHLRQAALDTGIDKDMVIKILARFESDGKIVHKDGWIVLLNFLKHQNLNTNMGKSAAKDVSTAPKWVSDAIVNGYGMVPEWFPNGYETIKGREGKGIEEKGREAEEKTAPGLEAVADELSILETESAFKIRLDLDTRQRIAKGVPKTVVQFWPAFIQARSVGWTTKPDAAKLRQIGYALTDFQRDHKKIYDQQKPDERLPTLAEKKAAILEQNKTRNEPPAGPLVMPRMQTEGQVDSTLITGN